MTATTQGTPTGDAPNDAEDTQRYLDLLRSVNQEWAELEDRGDESVQLSATARSTIRESVRAAARHGSHVRVGSTPEGPFTMSELALRGLVRNAVDGVRGVQSLKTRIDYQENTARERTRNAPNKVTCTIAVGVDYSSAHPEVTIPNLRHTADTVADAVTHELVSNLDLMDVTVDIHIADLYMAETREEAAR